MEQQLLSLLIFSCSVSAMLCSLSIFFFFNDTATTEIYTLSLHDALPICLRSSENILTMPFLSPRFPKATTLSSRSEERFSRNAETDLVCRLLLEKKKKIQR